MKYDIMKYNTTVSRIPEMELSYSQVDWWNSQRTHIKLKAQMQPFKVNWEFAETVEFSVNGEREISEMVRLLNDEFWPKKEHIEDMYDEIKELERLKKQSDNEFIEFTSWLLLDKSKTEKEIIDNVIDHIWRMSDRLSELLKKYPFIN